jgi:hypothetical protein
MKCGMGATALSDSGKRAVGSAEVQGSLQNGIGHLERVLGDRDRAVKAATADYPADGVSDECRGRAPLGGSRWRGVPLCLVLAEQQVFAIRNTCSHSAVSLAERKLRAARLDAGFTPPVWTCGLESRLRPRRRVPSPTRCGSRTETCTSG